MGHGGGRGVFGAAGGRTGRSGRGLAAALLLVLAGSGWSAPARLLHPRELEGVRVHRVVGTGEARVIFGARVTSPQEHHPLVLFRRQERWWIQSLEDHGQMGWVGALRLGELTLGVLDMDVESPGWRLEVLRQAAPGESWEAEGELPKPTFLALCEGITEVAPGVLEITLFLEDGLDPAVRSGRYQARSQDQGRSWGHFQPQP